MRLSRVLAVCRDFAMSREGHATRRRKMGMEGWERKELVGGNGWMEVGWESRTVVLRLRACLRGRVGFGGGYVCMYVFDVIYLFFPRSFGVNVDMSVCLVSCS